jgi:hypothetical protein
MSKTSAKLAKGMVEMKRHIIIMNLIHTLKKLEIIR